MACEEGSIEDCTGQCIKPGSPEYDWLGDRDCDNGVYGVFFNCPALQCDNGDCSAEQCNSVYTYAPTPQTSGRTHAPTSVKIADTECPKDSFPDCAGNCIKTGSEQADYLGDSDCDNGAYGVFFNCPAFECDKGDCRAEQCNSVYTFAPTPEDPGPSRTPAPSLTVASPSPAPTVSLAPTASFSPTLAEKACPNGSFADCAGQCVKFESEEGKYLGDGDCDNGAYGVFFNCPALKCDKGDCSAAQCNSVFTFGPTSYPTSPPAPVPAPTLAPTPATGCEPGSIVDCSGACIDPSTEMAGWIGDGYCDDGHWGAWFNCAKFSCDKGDCDASKCDTGVFTLGPTLAPTLAPTKAEDCPPGYFADCSETCVAEASDEATWLGDGTCDDGTWEVFYNCDKFKCDKGDCSADKCNTGVYTSGPTTTAPSLQPTTTPCPEGTFTDCSGQCFSVKGEEAGWVGDGSCDDGTWNAFFNCPAFECDKGDCTAEQCNTHGVYTIPPTTSETYVPTLTPRPTRHPTTRPVVASPGAEAPRESASATVGIVFAALGGVVLAVVLALLGLKILRKQGGLERTAGAVELRDEGGDGAGAGGAGAGAGAGAKPASVFSPLTSPAWGKTKGHRQRLEDDEDFEMRGGV